MGDDDNWYLSIDLERPDGLGYEPYCACDPLVEERKGNVLHTSHFPLVVWLVCGLAHQRGTRHVHGFPACQSVPEWMRTAVTQYGSMRLVVLQGVRRFPLELCRLRCFMRLDLWSPNMKTLPLQIGNMRLLTVETLNGNAGLERMPPTLVRTAPMLFQLSLWSKSMHKLLRCAYLFARPPAASSVLSKIHQQTATGVFDAVYAMYAVWRRQRRVPRALVRAAAVRILDTGHEVVWNAVLSP